MSWTPALVRRGGSAATAAASRIQCRVLVPATVASEPFARSADKIRQRSSSHGICSATTSVAWPITQRDLRARTMNTGLQQEQTRRNFTRKAGSRLTQAEIISMAEDEEDGGPLPPPDRTGAGAGPLHGCTDEDDFSHLSNEELADADTIPGWDLIHSPPRKIPRGSLLGTVVSDKMAKTVNVAVDRYRILPKVRVRRKYTRKFMAHDEEEVCRVGDLILITPCQRISRHKHFMVREIVRAKGVL